MPKPKGPEPAAIQPAPVGSPAATPGSGPQQPATGLRFEEAYARLEQLVGEMERGDLALEELLQRFEEGVGLVKHCQAFLAQAQLRVSKFVEQKDGQWVLKELEEERPQS